MTSMTSTLGPHTVDHHMTRVDIPTGMVFDFAHIRDITENGGTWQDIAAAVAANAPNDMMRYATLDMTALYATTDHRTKAVEYFVGNHVIADQMVRRDPKILLYAPLRILVHGGTPTATRLSQSTGPAPSSPAWACEKSTRAAACSTTNSEPCFRSSAWTPVTLSVATPTNKPADADRPTTSSVPAVAHRPLGPTGSRLPAAAPQTP